MMTITSGNNIEHARNGVGTKITYDTTVPGETVARSVLIGTANKARRSPQFRGNRPIKHFASGFVDRDTGDTISTTGGRSL